MAVTGSPLRRWGAVSALILVPVLASAGRGPADDSVVPELPLRERVVQLLERPTATEGETEVRERAGRIAALGGEVVPVVFDLLAARGESGTAPAPGTDGAFALGVLLLTCHELGRGALLRELHERAEAPASGGERAAVLRVLAEVGLASDLKHALRVAAVPRPADDNGDHLLVLLEETVQAMCERDRGTLFVLRGRLFDQPTRLAAPLLRAVGRIEAVDALPWLTDVLGWGKGLLDAPVLSQICVVAPSMPQPIDETLCRGVRAYLGREEPILRRQAIEAVGRLQDFAAVETLLSLLESEDAVDSELAHRALSQITALSLPPSVTRWRSWYQRERKWYEERVPILLNGLWNPNQKTILPALTELARYRFERHRLAAAIAPVLQHEDLTIVRMACASLRELRSPAPLRELVACLGSGDEGLDEAVHQTLRALTSLDPLPTPEAWEVALAGGATVR